MADNNGLIKIFEFALNQEYTGKSFFEASIGRMGYGAAISAFNRLIEEEDKHIEFISRILTNLYNEQEMDIPEAFTLESEVENYFDSRAKSEFLQQGITESMVPDVTVFNTAWLIEKDLSEFYGRMAKQTEGEARKSLEMLADWESAHERFFREYRDALTEAYSKMPWGG
jgi:rubrerythrin